MRNGKGRNGKQLRGQSPDSRRGACGPRGTVSTEVCWCWGRGWCGPCEETGMVRRGRGQAFRGWCLHTNSMDAVGALPSCRLPSPTQPDPFDACTANLRAGAPGTAHRLPCVPWTPSSELPCPVSQDGQVTRRQRTSTTSEPCTHAGRASTHPCTGPIGA